MKKEQKHHLLEVKEKDDGFIAVFADADVVGGQSGVETLRSGLRASKATGSFNISARQGVHNYTKDQLEERLESFKENGVDAASIAATERALSLIEEKSSGQKLVVSKPMVAKSPITAKN